MKVKKQAKKVIRSTRKSVTKRVKTIQRQKHRKYILLSLITFIAVMTIWGLIYTFYVGTSQQGRLVTFHDRGQNHVILTNARTVRQALVDANITVDAKDIVEPAIDSSLQSSDSTVIIYRARPVLVIDGSFRERILTPAQSPNEIATAIGIEPVTEKDKTSITRGSFIEDGATTKLVIERATPEVVKPVFAPTPQALTASKGAQLFVDSGGVAHRETYYDLPMNIVIRHCSNNDYSIRYDGAKIDSDGYVLVAANYAIYPKCSVVETSLGPGKVYDTGGFALRYPHGFDLATDWTNNNGR